MNLISIYETDEDETDHQLKQNSEAIAFYAGKQGNGKEIKILMT